MARHVRMFQRRFVDAILRGDKWHTIRPHPKRKILRGDFISLRYWKGKPYRSKQRVIMEVQVINVEGIRMARGTLSKHTTDRVFIYVAGRALTEQQTNTLATGDGFFGRIEMINWFEETHGFPFEGILIKWRPTKSER